MTEPVFRALAPLVTVWPSKGSDLNVLTATLPLMRTLAAGDSLEPLSQADGELMIQGREQGDWDSIEALLSLPVFTEQDTADVEALITQHSDWFLLAAQVNIADRELRLYSVLERKQRSISTYYRSLGAL
jgi:general secretion pathway protein K